jgi:hypothetical protein
VTRNYQLLLLGLTPITRILTHFSSSILDYIPVFKDNYFTKFTSSAVGSCEHNIEPLGSTEGGEFSVPVSEWH